MKVRYKLIVSVLAILLTPLVVTGITRLVGMSVFAPLITYFLCIIIFIYIHHLLVVSGIFFRIGLKLRRRFILSQTFTYVLRSSLLWMIFLPISRILGDLVKWYVTGEYVELSRGDYHLYIATLMFVGIGAGAFFSLAYLSIIRRKL